MTPQNATVQLLIRNTGDITARTLQLTDNDADFWDAVDFVSLGSITAPAVGTLRDADRIQIDAFVDGAWVNGTPAAIGSAALPGGVTPAQVRGLRFTFSDTSPLNDGFVLTPCDRHPVLRSRRLPGRAPPFAAEHRRTAPRPAASTRRPARSPTRLHPDPDRPGDDRRGHRRPQLRARRPAARRQQGAGEHDGATRSAGHVHARDEEQRHGQPPRRHRLGSAA